MRFMNCFLVVFFLGMTVCASPNCPVTAAETFTAEFKVVKVERPQVMCKKDETGKPLEKGLVFIEQQKGCILRLEVVKVTDGILPIENKEHDGIYSIFSDGVLCKKSSGDKLTSKIESIAFQCCIEESNALAGKTQYCKMKPKPTPVEKMSDKLLVCSQHGVNWKIVGK